MTTPGTTLLPTAPLPAATATIPTVLIVNGRPVELDIEPRRSLSDVLRRDLGSTGTTVGCDQGSCGSCTVLLDGEPARSCILLAVQVTGRRIETVESLAPEGGLSPLQQEFRRQGALQCGFCTPGFLMLGTELLRRCPRPTREQVVASVSANLCRCTGYAPIVDAVLAAAAGSDRATPDQGRVRS